MMLLTSANLFFYLQQRGLLDANAVVAGELRINSIVSRNRSFMVLRRDGPCYFVKQVKTWTGSASETLRAEAEWLQAIQTDPALAALTGLTARLYSYDPAAQALIMELLPGAPLTLSLSDSENRMQRQAARLGVMLGALHRELACCWVNGSSLAAYPPAMLWIVHQATFKPEHAAQSSGQTQFLAALARYPSLVQLFAELRAAWQATTIIHADLRLNNILSHDTGLYLVDWEQAGVGDPAWDLGSILQFYLGWWAALVAQGASQQVMQTATRACWRAYIQERGLAANDELLERSMACAGARLVQSTYESLYQASRLTASSVRMLQVGMNLLQDPAKNITEVMGSL